MAKEITLSKGNLCIYNCFIDNLNILTFNSFKEKLENEPRFESDLVLNFAMCSFINLRYLIHDPVLKCSANCFKEIYLPFNPIFLIKQ